MSSADQQARIRSAILMHSQPTDLEASALREFIRLSDSAIARAEKVGCALERAHKLSHKPVASWRLDKGTKLPRLLLIWLPMLIAKLRNEQAQQEMIEAQVHMGAYLALVEARMNQLAFFVSLDQATDSKQAGSDRGASDNG